MRLNPVLEREVRERPRTTGSVVMLTVYLVLVTAVFVTVYLAEKLVTGNQLAATSIARAGQEAFEWTLVAVLVMVLFLVPGYTASAITAERERRTLVSMQLTMLRPARIASGKAAASIAYLGLLLIATMPLLALSLTMGGVTLVQVLRGIGAVVVVGVVLAMVSVACSTLVRRTAAAVLLAYTAALVLLIGTVASWGTASAVLTARDPDRVPRFAPAVLTAANPLMFVSAAIDRSDPNAPLVRDNAPISPFRLLQDQMHGLQADVMTVTALRAPSSPAAVPAGTPVDGSGSVAPMSDPGTPLRVQQPGPFRHFLWWSLGSLVAVGAASWLVAARRLRLPIAVER